LFHAAEGKFTIPDRLASLGTNYDRACGAVRQALLAGADRQVPDLGHLGTPTTIRGCLRGLEIGVNDYLPAPGRTSNELLARARNPDTQARYTDHHVSRQCAELDRNGDHRCADRPA